VERHPVPSPHVRTAATLGSRHGLAPSGKIMLCSSSRSTPERHQGPVPIGAESGEQLVERLVRDLPRHPLSDPRAEQTTELSPKGLHRVVMLVRPAPAATRQRERVHHRPRPGLQVELIERPQHRLAVRAGGDGVRPTRRRLPGHRVRGPRRPTLFHPARRPDRMEPATWTHRQKSRASARVGPDPSSRRSPTRTGTSAATASRTSVASSQAAPMPAGRSGKRRPDRSPPRLDQVADAARTDPPSPSARPARLPPTRPSPVARLLRSRDGTVTAPLRLSPRSSVNRQILIGYGQ